MSGLFDFIKGMALVAGGAKEARQDQSRVDSENKYREDTTAVKREEIEANKELAAAQRAHTELLQTRGFGQEEKMLGKKIDWEKEKIKFEQEFTKSESKLVRDNAVALAQLRIDAEKEMQERGIQSQTDLQRNDLDLRLRVAKMDEALRSRGLQLESNKIMNEFTLGKMKTMIDLVGLATKYTQGSEGLMTAVSRSSPKLSALLSNQESNNLSVLLRAIDPKGDLGFRDHNLMDFVKPIQPEEGASEEARQIMTDLGMPGIASRVAPVKPPVTLPLPAGVDRTAIAPRLGSSASSFNFNPPQLDIHPGDLLGLDKITQQIQGLPEADRPTAFGEYKTLINDPANAFVGGSDPLYRQKMINYLGKSTGFDLTK